MFLFPINLVGFFISLKCYIHILCERFWINLVWPCFLFSPLKSAPTGVVSYFLHFAFLYLCISPRSIHPRWVVFLHFVSLYFPQSKKRLHRSELLRRLVPIGWPCLPDTHWPVLRVHKPRKQQTKSNNMFYVPIAFKWRNKNGHTGVNIKLVSYIIKPNFFDKKKPFVTCLFCSRAIWILKYKSSSWKYLEWGDMSQHWPWLWVEKALCSPLDLCQEHSCQ